MTVAARRPPRPLGELGAVLTAVAAVAGSWAARPLPLVVPCLVAVVAFARRDARWLPVVALLATSTMAARAWDGVAPAPASSYRGPAVLVGDPQRRGPVVHAVLEVRGKRYDVWAGGSPGRRLERRSAQQVVIVEGRLLPPPAGRRHQLAVRHIVGEMDVAHVLDWAPGSPLARSTERTRQLLERGAAAMHPVDRSLYLGLVLGDDRGQPDSLVVDFRRSGLGHLTAVSGQNVAFMLAVAGPALRRLRPGWRWAVTVGLLAWFAALTRFEPSVLRATVMAGVAATAFGLGRATTPQRVLCLTVSGLLIVDPFLVWSVGFWLSSAATAGIVVLSKPIATSLPGPLWLRVPVSVSLAAQLGVAPVAWWVFGGEPVAALPANVLAEPAAAFTMTYGLPAGVLAGVVGGPLAALAHGPVVLCVRWLQALAGVCAELDHPSLRPVVGAGHVIVLGWVVWRRRRTPAVGSSGEHPPGDRRRSVARLGGRLRSRAQPGG
jgi:competence protein ComEC